MCRYAKNQNAENFRCGHPCLHRDYCQSRFAGSDAVIEIIQAKLRDFGWSICAHVVAIMFTCSEAETWIDADPAANQMCDGCWLGSTDCVGADKAYALAPVDGQANGMRTPGMAISKEDARISVTYCAEKMRNERDCSKQFIGVSMKDGHCWCSLKNKNCDNFVNFAIFAAHFFKKVKQRSKVKKSLVVSSARRLSTKCTYVYYV